MKNVEMPKMGDTMEEGKILHWLKKVGDAVKKGEPVAEVETDKVNIEIESFASGVLRKILVTEGQSAPIGASIALIGTPDEPLPISMDDNGTTATKNPSLYPVNNLQTGKNIAQESPQVYSSSPAEHVSLPAQKNSQERIFISPIARHLADDHVLDYTLLRGTGPNGRIIKLDIEAALNQQHASIPTMTQSGPVPALQESALVEMDEVTEIPLTAMRRTIAKRLSQSMQTAPHFYVTSVIDMGNLTALRQQINKYAATDPEPVKVSFNDLIVKAVARALEQLTQVNVSFTEDRLLQKRRIHIGIAVAIEQGLIVPVLRDANRRGILAVARESRKLAEAARKGNLRPEEFSGGTFTVSNLGMFDVDSFTAVINPPESAILAIGSITPTPAIVDGQLAIRDRMKVTLSSDHRAIDGATAARFLQKVKHLLEEPFSLLM